MNRVVAFMILTSATDVRRKALMYVIVADVDEQAAAIPEESDGAASEGDNFIRSDPRPATVSS